MAATLYYFCIENGIAFSGVSLEPKSLKAIHKFGETVEDIADFINSKYTFSFLGTICKDILYRLEEQKVLFIGLPCQVAAVKKYVQLKQGKVDNLIAIDLICHGVPSHVYLSDHVKSIAGEDDVDSISFRDENWMTSKFVFSVSHNNKKYHKYVESNDNYQIGYHNATIYRENCYHCMYAKPKRTGDLTISDFSGFGRIKPFNGNIRREQYLGLSCVLVNTKKGEEIFNQIIADHRLVYFERPLEEALSFEEQLKGPSKKSCYRNKFESLYPQNGFTRTMNQVFRKEKIKRPVIKYVKDCVKFVLRRK